VKDITQLGFEIWHPMPNGALLQMFAEYANTICMACTPTPTADPSTTAPITRGALNVEGYRYHIA
jgi:hypothetical protein